MELVPCVTSQCAVRWAFIAILPNRLRASEHVWEDEWHGEAYTKAFRRLHCEKQQHRPTQPPRASITCSEVDDEREWMLMMKERGCSS
eukprot:2349000-Rhodomonas_salina.2